jgi:hypothetical protein
MSSLVQTLRLWGLSAHGWLTGYLSARAQRAGRPPEGLRRWLPWQMTQAERAGLRVPGSAGGQRGPDSS